MKEVYKHGSGENNREAVYEFSIGLRFTHWVRAISIIVLTVSGLYIAYVFAAPVVTGEPTNFMNAKWRAVHEVAGFILLGCLIFKSYLFFFDRKSHGERISIKDSFNIKTWVAQIKYYLFIGEHPHLKGVYNPLQFVSYVVFYLLMIGLCLTGFILYANNYHEGFGGLIYECMRSFEAMFGGLANVRQIHHILTWAVVIFVCVHIYMAVFNAIKGKDGGMDAIFSGYKYIKDGKRT